ncbi:MAG: hypothetical protein K8T20_06905 [Planctomycetes bacterium]|nr:hypothetical protein [Planctomycetota bacterium]
MIRVAAIFLLTAAALRAQSFEKLEVLDAPGDAGGAAWVIWKRLPAESDEEGAKRITYVVSVAKDATGDFEEVARFPATAKFMSDNTEAFGWSKKTADWHAVKVDAPGYEDGSAANFPVYAKVVALSAESEIASGTASGIARPNWLTASKFNVFVFIALLGGVMMFLIARARRNSEIFVRRIPGLDAMEEAIGRATEMGKPILFLNGLNDMSSISTIASTAILGQVAKRVATYDTQILVPCFDPVVMAVSQEVMREGFISAGRPDSYRPDSAFFVTSDQFGYVAAVDGIMMREKPAACFYMGYYYAESLLLAETGGTTGAIQIAGTDSVTQLPFFIASCDYTLLGEELYAASAYLSREPIQLGSLIAQDWGKLFVLAAIVIGTVLALFHVQTFVHMVATY